MRSWSYFSTSKTIFPDDDILFLCFPQNTFKFRFQYCRERVAYFIFTATRRMLQTINIPYTEGNNSLCSTRGNPFNISTGISKVLRRLAYFTCSSRRGTVSWTPVHAVRACFPQSTSPVLIRRTVEMNNRFYELVISAAIIQVKLSIEQQQWHLLIHSLAALNTIITRVYCIAEYNWW